MSEYTEDTLVQKTTSDYLAQLGWKSVYAYNNEDFGPESLPGRETDREEARILPPRAMLVRLYRRLLDDAVRRIDVLKRAIVLLKSKRDLLLPRLRNREITI